jgi:peptidoglycan/LPS O-acetylase OafA/YrhL
MLIHFYPGHSWYINVIGSLLVAGIFAYVSWTFLESKVMAQKGRVLNALTQIQVASRAA